MNRERDQLKQWARIAGIPETQVSTRDDLTGLFQRFRPNGEGVEAVLRGLVRGDEVLGRLLALYQATANSYRPSDAYFVVRRERPMPASVAEIAREHFAAMALIARAMGEAELEGVLRGVSPELIDEPTSTDEAMPDDDAPEVWLHDVVFDYMSGLSPVESDVFLLDEAFYSVANDLYLKNFLMWPLYEGASETSDPFGPYFRLWSQGVRILFRPGGSCHLLAT